MFAVFGRNDLRGVGRESLLFGVFAAPLVWVALVRFATPAVSSGYHIDLVPYYPVILTGLLLLTSPIVVGGLTALVVLDERDAKTLTALRITPVPFRSYVGYRAVVTIVLTAVFVIGTISASGLMPWRLLPSLLLIGLVTGLSGVVICLAMLAFANNKVEGLAVLRGLGLAVAGLPLIPFFLDSPWQLAFGLIPTYWPAKAFWVAWDGGPWWAYLLVGAVYCALLAWPLHVRFAKSVS